jgi:opacity protein-like surface antigen
MSGRHRARSSKSNLVIGSIAASVGVSSVLAAAVVELVSPQAPPTAAGAVQQEQSVTQQGRLIAVTSDSLTTQSADGTVHTFSITPDTTAVTEGGQSSTPAGSFTVNDEVLIVGTRKGGDAVATAIAEKSAVGPQGRPMDYGL